MSQKHSCKERIDVAISSGYVKVIVTLLTELIVIEVALSGIYVGKTSFQDGAGLIHGRSFSTYTDYQK